MLLFKSPQQLKHQTKIKVKNEKGLQKQPLFFSVGQTDFPPKDHAHPNILISQCGFKHCPARMCREIGKKGRRPRASRNGALL